MNEVQVVMAWDEAREYANKQGFYLTYDEYMVRFELRDPDGDKLVAVGETVDEMLKLMQEHMT